MAIMMMMGRLMMMTPIVIWHSLHIIFQSMSMTAIILMTKQQWRLRQNFWWYFSTWSFSCMSSEWQKHWLWFCSCQWSGWAQKASSSGRPTQCQVNNYSIHDLWYVYHTEIITLIHKQIITQMSVVMNYHRSQIKIPSYHRCLVLWGSSLGDRYLGWQSI